MRKWDKSLELLSVILIAPKKKKRRGGVATKDRASTKENTAGWRKRDTDDVI